MATQHDPANFIAGDTWFIYATCIDANDSPFNLTGMTVAWTLANRNSGLAIIRPSECIVTVTNAAAGQCTIEVPGRITAKVGNGAHQDALRLTNATGGTVTLAVGPVLVLADPFKVPAASVRVAAQEAADQLAGSLDFAAPLQRPA